MRSLLVLFFLVCGVAAASAAPKLANQTVVTFDPGHGTQIEYYDADGSTFLWYPGNRVILPGQWKLKGKDICYRYGANTHNPVTGQSGGGWECMPSALHQSAIVETANGDVFGLAGRQKVPFRLSRKQTSIEALLKKIR